MSFRKLSIHCRVRHLQLLSLGRTCLKIVARDQLAAAARFCSVTIADAIDFSWNGEGNIFEQECLDIHDQVHKR
jgi:hypothetical protein